MHTGFLIAGLTITTIGKVMLGITVLLAHGKISEEHKIDRKVLKEFAHERNFGIAGIVLMIVGYLLELFFYLVGGTVL